MKCSLNELDFKIICKFVELPENQSMTTWELMKKIYTKEHHKDKEHLMIRRHIKKMSECGIFDIKKIHGVLIYTLISEALINNCKLKEGKINKNISIKIEGRWWIKEL